MEFVIQYYCSLLLGFQDCDPKNLNVNEISAFKKDNS
jgi:hypothetical protein